ncbi:hypothetical protein EG328_009961 [Venturia inaequalis]|uniref:PiggyBac transposable element-derived protein domain-containing protein n=1 Tax=Venturia inaequalis TaxID=5025 RepID=A0A8H3U7Z6_VENIN|nr:hypothetical protein EG328_009961 [Venturia inaequalis]
MPALPQDFDTSGYDSGQDFDCITTRQDDNWDSDNDAEGEYDEEYYSQLSLSNIQGEPPTGFTPICPAENEMHDLPFAFFSLFFDEDMFKAFANWTNQYAVIMKAKAQREKGIDIAKHWFETDAGELMVWLGLVIYMGTHRIQNS